MDQSLHHQNPRSTLGQPRYVHHNRVERSAYELSQQLKPAALFPVGPSLVSIEACRNQNIKNPQNISYEVSRLRDHAKTQILF
jgi:hypothetical protein